MRKIMATAIVFTLAYASPSWALLGLGDFSFDGALEVRGNSADNETNFGPANDHRGNTATRVRVGANFQVTDMINSRLELVRAPIQYGQVGKPTAVSTEETIWVFTNAFVEFENLWGFQARLGRQYVGETNDLVWYVGHHNDDSLTTTSIDGLALECAKSEKQGGFWDKIHLIFFTGRPFTPKGTLADTDATFSGDVDVSNIEAQLNIIPNGRVRLAYLLGDDDNTSAQSDNNHLRIIRAGINGGVFESKLTYRAEFLQNMGEFDGAGFTSAGAADKLEYKGNAIDLGVGINSPETSAGTFGGWVNFVSASGDDKINDNEDKSFHDFSIFGVGDPSNRYFGEIFGKSNTLGGGTPLGQGIDTAGITGTGAAAGTQGAGLEILNIGAQFNPSFVEKTWLRLDYYTFSRNEDRITTSAGGTLNAREKFGNEIDITLGYDYSQNVSIYGGYAQLDPKEALTTASSKEDVTKWFAKTMIKWGGAEK